MTAPTDSPDFPDIDRARQELREGIRSSHEIVRQTRLLIELSEADGQYATNDEDCGVAN